MDVYECSFCVSLFEVIQAAVVRFYCKCCDMKKVVPVVFIADLRMNCSQFYNVVSSLFIVSLLSEAF